MNQSVELLEFSNRRKVPLVLQTEMAECGLACLAMIAGYHGHHLDMPAMRQRFPAGQSGMTLHNVMQVAENLKLSTRALQCPLEDMDKLALPAILHWDMNHFVVLTRADKKGMQIHDPARGKQVLSHDVFSQHYTGIALECRPTESFTTKQEKQGLRLSQLWGSLTGLKKSLISLLALSLILQVFALAMPYYMQITLDEVLVNGDAHLLTVIAIGFLLITLMNVMTHTTRSWLILRVSSLFNMQVGTNVFHHLLRLPLAFFQKRHVGDVLSRFESLHAIRDALTRNLVESVVDGLMTIGLLIMMLLYSVQLTLIVLVAVALYTLLRLALFSPLRRRSEDSIQAKAKEQSHFIESLRAMQAVKLMVRENQRENLWQNRYADVINTEISLGRLSIGFDAANRTLFGIEHIAIIFMGAKAVIAGHFTVGALLAFVAYKTQLSERVSQFINNMIDLKMLRLHLDRLSDIALEDQEAHRHGQSLQKTWQGELTLDNISFTYGPNQPELLQNVNATIKAGESVVITGLSGSGKSTLMKIMLGLLQPTSGRVLLDGVDINEMGLTHYRQLLGAVMQDDTLLAGSILDNIGFFDPEADHAKVHQCAQWAAIDKDIQQMTMGYLSPVGDLGDALSGGQRQRLLLARALYQSPKLLFLDEATSHLDTDNEAQITQHVAQLAMTRIAIAHRPETIAQAERILHLHHGQLTESHSVPVSKKATA
ncbi:MAG: peptidase domain-containing ABC transporter [Pseudomonadota bacterium]